MRLLDRIVAELESQARAAGAALAGGLLLGHAREDGLWIERALPCRNGAPPEQHGTRFEIEAQVLQNVRRTLERGPLAILGSYLVHGLEHPDGEAASVEPHWIGPDSLGLTLVRNGGEGLVPRLWISGGGTDRSEQPIEWYRQQVLPPVVCPE